jgi:hypothetical protein
MKDFFQAKIRTLEPIRQFPWHEARAYAQFLAQTSYYVCHSTRLLGLCASRIGIEREKLHQRFLKHAVEERIHHLLAARDIEHLGFKLRSMPELPITGALYKRSITGPSTSVERRFSGTSSRPRVYRWGTAGTCTKP